MHKKFDNEPLTELNKDYKRLTKILTSETHLFKKIIFKSKLFLFSQRQNILKYTILIIGLIMYFNSGIFFSASTHVNQISQLVAIGLVFSVLWVINGND